MIKIPLLLLVLVLSLQSIAGESRNSSKVIRLATTTSVENSGLLDYLLPKFMAQHAYEVRPTIVGSGKALRLGRTGAVDVVWVHSPLAEKAFVDQGYGVNRHPVMRNDFVLAGPTSDPANIDDSADILQALRMIATQGSPFLSRGDDSGTNKKELALWTQAGIDPYGSDWYLESGVGMAASLTMAEEENAYIMIDRATLEVRRGSGVSIFCEDPVKLSNSYSVIAVNPERNADVNLKGANIFIQWLVSGDGQASIAGYAPKGKQLYYPARSAAGN